MKRSVFSAALGLACLSAIPAQAGIFTDDLTKCIVISASPDDQMVLSKWMFVMMSTNPDIQSYSKVGPEQIADFNKKAADLSSRLLTKDCKGQTVAALRNEGGSAISASFSMLGQVAMRRLMSDPNVSQMIQGMGRMLGTDLEGFVKENGLENLPGMASGAANVPAK